MLFANLRTLEKKPWTASAPYMQDKFCQLKHNYINMKLIYVNMQHDITRLLFNSLTQINKVYEVK